MPQNFQLDVFLSHSPKDKTVVRQLAKRLRNDGLSVWFDDWWVKPGDDIPAKIEEGLEHSRVLVLCMSANAFGSDWTKLESQTFRFRDPENKDRRFIPLRLDGAPIKASLGQFLCIDWRPDFREKEFTKLLEWCRSGAPEPPPPETQEQFNAALISLGHSDNVVSVAWSPDGMLALSGSADSVVRLWDVSSGRCLRVFEGHSDGISCVAWSTDGKQALSSSGDTTIRLWEIASGRCLRVFQGHRELVKSVAWSPNGEQALSGSSDRTMRLWEIASGHCVRVFEGHHNNVWSVAWSPNGEQALSSSFDNTVRLWDVASGRCLRLFAGHTDSVWSVAWSPDGKQALSGSGDKIIRLWEIATGRCLRVYLKAMMNASGAWHGVPMVSKLSRARMTIP